MHNSKGKCQRGKQHRANCTAYASNHQREKNKARRLFNYLRRHGKTDFSALDAFDKLELFWPKGASKLYEACRVAQRGG